MSSGTGHETNDAPECPRPGQPGAAGVRPQPVAYAVSLAAVTVATVLARVIWPVIEPSASPLFFAAIVFSAWYGGLGPGLLASALAIPVKAYFFVSPIHSLGIDNLDDLIQLTLFALVAVLVSSLSGAMRHAQAGSARLAEREAAARTEAEAATRAKDAFLATLSHELRTPLTAILGWSRVLRASAKDEPVRRAVEAIERSAAAQARLIEDLLDVASIVAGKVRLDMRSVDALVLVETALEAAMPAAASAGVQLTSALDRTPVALHGDADRLRQAIDNVLANALKFTPPGGAVHVRLGYVGDRVKIAVRDTGAGLAPEDLPRIFEPFWQATPGHRAQGGLGLGLALTRHITELHGGTVRAESAGHGKGATFTIELPVHATVAPADGVPVSGDYRASSSS